VDRISCVRLQPLTTTAREQATWAAPSTPSPTPSPTPPAARHEVLASPEIAPYALQDSGPARLKFLFWTGHRWLEHIV